MNKKKRKKYVKREYVVSRNISNERQKKQPKKTARKIFSTMCAEHDAKLYPETSHRTLRTHSCPYAIESTRYTPKTNLLAYWCAYVAVLVPYRFCLYCMYAMDFPRRLSVVVVELMRSNFHFASSIECEKKKK